MVYGLVLMGLDGVLKRTFVPGGRRLFGLQVTLWLVAVEKAVQLWVVEAAGCNVGFDCEGLLGVVLIGGRWVDR